MARFKGNGSLDATFNGSGTKLLPYGYDFTWAHDMLVQPDGKIVVAGEVPGLGALLWRVRPGGSLDTSFSGDGRALFTGGHWTYALARQPDGKYVLGGSVSTGGQYDFALARVLP
jgi:uncharacterized delta-60 repeat protein